MPNNVNKIYNGILLSISLAIFINLAGCDRIEGKAKDLANSSAQTLKTVVRDVTVSDLQKNAESICINAYTNGIGTPEPPVYGDYAAPAYFSISRNWEIQVSVIGDGKYQISVPLFRRDGINGLFNGRCIVENGHVIEAKLFAPS